MLQVPVSVFASITANVYECLKSFTFVHTRREDLRIREYICEYIREYIREYIWPWNWLQKAVKAAFPSSMRVALAKAALEAFGGLI